MNKDLILAIETSCDETSVALIRKWVEVLSLKTASSIKLHQLTKWVIPEVAARAQSEYMMEVMNEALNEANVKMEDIDAFWVTIWPWLIWSLLVWVSTANSLSLIYKKKLYWINHINGHIYANLLGRKISDLKFPSIVLTASWWHNEIYLWKDINSLTLIWESLDDSAWEAFDKCWRLIWLDYPAGAAISKLSLKWNKDFFKFPRPLKNSWNFDFSFSWLKTAFLYKLKEYKQVNDQLKADFASSLQEAICDILSDKVVKASVKYWVKQIHLSWWVSANTRLRELVTKKSDLKLLCPVKIEYCTDNAAMIGAAAYFQDIKESRILEAMPRL